MYTIQNTQNYLFSGQVKVFYVANMDNKDMVSLLHLGMFQGDHTYQTYPT